MFLKSYPTMKFLRLRGLQAGLQCSPHSRKGQGYRGLDSRAPSRAFVRWTPVCPLAQTFQTCEQRCGALRTPGWGLVQLSAHLE